jgi:hypothetical protein
VDQITLPIGLPSLKIAWLILPQPMSEADYEVILRVLDYCKAELTKTPTAADVRQGE